MNIAYNLRKLRAKSKKSQQDVADLLEIDRRTYINQENEKNDVKSDYIPKLAEIFKVEIKDLFQDSKSNLKAEDIAFSESLINGVVFVVTDKESISKLAEVLKINIQNG